MSSATPAPATARPEMVLNPTVAARVSRCQAQIRSALKVYHYHQSLTLLGRHELAYGNPESRQPPAHIRAEMTTREWIGACIDLIEEEMARRLQRVRVMEKWWKDLVLGEVERWEEEVKEAAEQEQGSGGDVGMGGLEDE